MTFLYLGTHTKMKSSPNSDTDEKELGNFPEYSCCSLLLLYDQNDLWVARRRQQDLFFFLISLAIYVGKTQCMLLFTERK